MLVRAQLALLGFLMFVVALAALAAASSFFAPWPFLATTGGAGAVLLNAGALALGVGAWVGWLVGCAAVAWGLSGLLLSAYLGCRDGCCRPPRDATAAAHAGQDAVRRDAALSVASAVDVEEAGGSARSSCSSARAVAEKAAPEVEAAEEAAEAAALARVMTATLEAVAAAELSAPKNAAAVHIQSISRRRAGHAQAERQKAALDAASLVGIAAAMRDDGRAAALQSEAIRGDQRQSEAMRDDGRAALSATAPRAAMEGEMGGEGVRGRASSAAEEKAAALQAKLVDAESRLAAAEQAVAEAVAVSRRSSARLSSGSHASSSAEEEGDER